MNYSTPRKGFRPPRNPRRMMGLGQDPTVDTSYDPNLVSPAATFDITSISAPVVDIGPVSVPTVTGPDSGNPIADFFNSLTAGARAATAVYSAADLISINQQRAARGMLPIDQYGVIGGSGAGTTRSVSAGIGLSWPILALLGIGLVVALRR